MTIPKKQEKAVFAAFSVFIVLSSRRNPPGCSFFHLAVRRSTLVTPNDRTE